MKSKTQLKRGLKLKHYCGWVAKEFHYCNKCHRFACPMRESNGFGNCQWFTYSHIFDKVWTIQAYEWLMEMES